jgi:hypothetical protein
MKEHFMKFPFFLAALLVINACAGGSATRPELKNASIDSIYPSIVLPGTLLVVTGAGFGKTPAPVSIGGAAVTDFVSWDDSTVAFRIPEGVKSGDTVKIGGAVSPASVDLAPKGSIRVVWLLDAARAQALIDKNYTNYNITSSPKLTPPLSIKGQWQKTVGNVGQYDQGWAGGAKVPMAKLPGGDVWCSECVFTPEAQASMENKPMLFAFEDENVGDRTVSGFESDPAAIIKQEWAKVSSTPEITSDPGVMVSAASKAFVAASNAIILSFPK